MRGWGVGGTRKHLQARCATVASESCPESCPGIVLEMGRTAVDLTATGGSDSCRWQLTTDTGG